MKKMFKLLIPILVVALLFASCSSGNSDNQSLTNPHENTDTSFKVAIIQSDESPYSAEIRKAFIARMRTLGYDEAKMKFDIKNAMGDAEKLAQLVTEVTAAKYDLIVPIADIAACAVSQSGTTIPSVFIGVNDPVSKGLTTNIDTPDKNMTGTATSMSAEDLFTLMKILTPSVNNIGIIYTDEAVRTSAFTTESEKYLTDNGYTFEEKQVDVSNVNEAVADLLTRVDTLFIPDDVALENSIPAVFKLAADNGKVIYAATYSAVTSGALASSSVNLTDIARSSALLADKILQGSAMSAVPITVMNEPMLYVSQSTAVGLKIDLPTSLKNMVLI